MLIKITIVILVYLGLRYLLKTVLFYEQHKVTKTKKRDDSKDDAIKAEFRTVDE